MHKIITLKGMSIAKRLTLTALFAALCCVSTVLITIPLPASGYFNTGDVFVLLSAWCLGPIYGVVAAAVGSALGDLFLGYAIYAPATFLVKGLDAFIACCICWFFKKLIRKQALDFLPRIFSAIFGELIMILGYFLFEILLYGLYGAFPNVLGNSLQAVCCTVCAVLVVSALYNMKAVRDFFPPLKGFPQGIKAKTTEETV
ncbi:MAG: ECF transporter S component [Clostridia bacterium]|nr:ECF transporter S component [Clostridia bacterium]